MRSEPTRIGQVSHWYTRIPDYRARLPGHRDADVCIVGAGFTGLWTAYYLKRADPSLRIVVLEARFPARRVRSQRRLGVGAGAR